MKDIVNLAVDLMRGKQTFTIADQEGVEKTYSAHEAADILREALIDANGGSTKFDRKTLRRNKVQIFEIIEELVPVIIHEGLEGDEFWMNFVDERNIAYGDVNEFFVPDNSTFIVTKIADGIGTPDRQRIDHGRKVTIETTKHAVRMYDDFGRFMAGRIDWAALCEKVAKSFRQAIWDDIYTAFNGITNATLGLNSTYVYAGSYSATNLRTLIAHVEAATGETPVLVGTKAALALCEGAEKADSAKESMHNAGFYGMFEGTPMVMLKQKHRPGTDTFLLSDTVLYVVAAGDKFIKLVNEGDAYIDDRDQTRNADMTMEYFMTMDWGVGLVISGKIGKYSITG